MRQAERRERTTTKLLDAAAHVFAERGFHAATLDDVADAAGYTKGAVYANFGGKDNLFLALLDRHLEAQLEAVDHLVTGETAADLRTDLELASSDQAESNGSFGILMLEFWAYAARNDHARSALAGRYREMRDRLSGAISVRDAGTGTGRSAAHTAAAVLAVDAGMFLQHLIDPDAVTPTMRVDALTQTIAPG